ncbi:KAT8 regulatory NSL complex subunit 1-like protein [Chiloscyllium plagiosum]|uniref:KAT8 regulatory NSL complex subunit 1-like protein n=1 Tax=Chiloscyllium plagiosum TaxID=36176 RepID=UPI001CB829E0|nr:KAT8 regulatory NSL complex subunit 1-like protein [Chiloscyllium plagiosum]
MKGNIFIAVGLLGQHCMVTMAPALTETATEPHGFQLLSSSLSSSFNEPDTFFHEEDTITEQKLNEESNTQSAWSQLAYPFATCGLGSDAPDLKHVPYGSITVHCAIPSNAALLTSPNSLLDKLSLNCKLNIRKTLFSKSSAVILAKKLSCDRTKQVSASKACKMYFVPEAELSSSNNDKKDLNFQKDNALECTGMLSTAHQVKLACDSVSMTLNNAGGMTSNQKVMLKPVKANKTWDTVPALDDFEFESLLNSTRQLILQRNEEKQLHGSTSIRKNEINTQLFECLSRQQELAKKSSRLKKHLQLIQAKHVECQIKCKIQDVMKCQLEKQAKRSKIDISNTETVFPFGIKHSGVHTGFISNSINSEFYEYVSFSKALLSHIKESVDSDATSSSTEEDTDSEEIALNRNMPFKYRSERRWIIDRAEVASRWTWLQAQIAELEYRIRQINEIYKHLRAAKETVTLDASQLSEDALEKQMELTEAAALLAATKDNKTPVEIKDLALECNLEITPSSPLLLLRNIDKQSAQLTESVNSLIPPLNLSPASSPVSWKRCRHHDGLVYSVLGDDMSGSSNCSGSEDYQPKTEHPDRTTQRPLSVDDTSARTRPLRMHHKHRLLCCVYDTSKRVQQVIPAQCKHYCEMCGPNSTTDAIDPRTMTLEEQVAVLDPCFHPVLSPHSDMPVSVHVQTLLHNEDWNKQPFPSMNELKASLSNSTPCKSHPCENTLDSIRSNVKKNHYTKMLTQHWDQSASDLRLQTPELRKPLKELRKRRHSNEKVAALSKRHCSLINPRETPGTLVKTAQISVSFPIQQTPCSSPTDTRASRATLCQRPLLQTKDIPSRQKQQSECCYDIDNIVIPMSLVASSKIEKLQYKEIITPSWQIVPIKPSKERLTQREVLEDISDEAFSLRHKKHEIWEQARWFLWEQSRCHRRGNRSSSFSKNNDEHLNPHPPASPEIQNQLSCTSSVCRVSEVAQTDDPQDLLVEGVTSAKVVLPWNCRTFPLSDEETKHLTHPKPLSSRNHLMVVKDTCNSVSFLSKKKSIQI